MKKQKMKKQKIIALGLAVGLIVSTISPSIAGTLNNSKEIQNGNSEKVVPFDMKKYKDLNEKLGNISINNTTELVSTKSTKKRADISINDYEELYNSGMTHDEIVDVLESAGEQEEQVSSIISEVKKSYNGKGINKENLKKELDKRKNSKDQKSKKINRNGDKLKEYIIKQQKKGKVNNSKTVIIDKQSNNTPIEQEYTQTPKLPEDIIKIAP
jgi:hypothetical protein